MKLLNYEGLNEKINNYNDLENSIFIEPLLDVRQISSVCVDLRLDVNFYVPVKTNESLISCCKGSEDIENFFESTYRKIGDSFIIYPNQFIIMNTLEYIRLPKNIHAEVVIRSSFERLGLYLYSIVQPGYSGVLTLSLKSSAETPVELVVGSRIAQIKFFDNKKNKKYSSYSESAKYFCAVEPELSKIFKDDDIEILNKIKNVNA